MLESVQKMQKVKASDKFSFPMSLDTASLIGNKAGVIDLDEEASETNDYELAAILFHKGPSASHGHYGMITKSYPPFHNTACIFSQQLTAKLCAY